MALMVRKGFFLVLWIIFLACSVNAAILHGSVYDVKLRSINNAIIEINSSPSQIFVSKEGQYSFVLEPGHYQVTAFYEVDGIGYGANESVVLSRDGYFVRDILLESESGEVPPEQEPEKEKPGNVLVLIIVGLIVLIIVIGSVFYRFVRKTKKTDKKEIETEEKDESKTEEKAVEEPKKESIDKSYLEQVLDIIKAEDGRTTQKHIRKQIPLSEAKISLIITELEETGKIKKIKKGRGNVIIFNEESSS